jgi:hypothetical protein
MNIISKDFINYIVTDLNKLLLLCFDGVACYVVKCVDAAVGGEGDYKGAACSRRRKQYFLCMFYC